mgnify:CR=1 FL=1
MRGDGLGLSLAPGPLARMRPCRRGDRTALGSPAPLRPSRQPIPKRGTVAYAGSCLLPQQMVDRAKAEANQARLLNEILDVLADPSVTDA